jgi:hypothetical protein
MGLTACHWISAGLCHEWKKREHPCPAWMRLEETSPVITGKLHHE